ncbi:7725_t:CDS:10 [Racocetra fulgida]|uniref:phosphatidate phosphatase n=1 Tax=Racocetra fulgida TaxID=60492 RepID=A0A9N9D0D1_9GLOM|nr:7725_t:CDS:10 [Racocetra fulgida]
MQSVYKLVSTVNQFYREINPATLSGAIDVIVVQQPNGDLACSPFHVRFGKLSVLRPQEKKVEMTVNGKVVDFPMKIGEAGEAFFVFQTDKMVPQELQTSPLAGPTEYSLTEERTGFTTPIYDFGRNNILGSDFGAEEGASDPENATDLESAISNAVVPVGFTSDDETNAGKVIVQIDSLEEVHEVERNIVNGQTNSNIAEVNLQQQDSKLEYDYGSNIISTEKSEMNEKLDYISCKLQNEGVEFDNVQTNEGVEFDNVQTNEGVEYDNVQTNEGVEYDNVQTNDMSHNDFHLESKIDITEQSSIDDGEILEDKISNNERPLSMPLYEPVNDPKHTAEWSWGWGTLPVRTSDKMEHWQESSDNKEWKDHEKQTENTSGVQIEDKNYCFEMSLCGSDTFGSDEKTDAELFRKHLITFEKFTENPQLLNDKALVIKYEDRLDTSESQEQQFYAKTLRLTSDQLGANTMTFSVATFYQGKATCVAKLFFWDDDTHIVVSDIDGTITKSDALGHVFTMIGKDWTHYGVAKLYSDIHKNGYQILYLTSRAIGQADYTRDYLEKVKQDKYQLPEGPVIMSPDRLLTAFHREVIMRKPEAFKIACLRDVRKLFGDRNPFFAGFGNRITDALSYRSVNIPSSRIFTIDTNGEVKLELLAGYNYVDLSDLVDQIFPHIDSKWDTIYNDWNYWKPDLPEIELPPEIYEVSTLSPQKSGSDTMSVTEDQYGEEDDSDFEADIPADIDLREYPY